MTQINLYKGFLALLPLMISLKPGKFEACEDCFNLDIPVTCIACFKCVSVGKDNPSCEDPFHNNMTRGEVSLEQPCMGGRKGRDGLFPASDCIKVTGNYGKFCLPRREFSPEKKRKLQLSKSDLFIEFASSV